MMESGTDDEQHQFAAQMAAARRLFVVRFSMLRRIMQASARIAFGRETDLREFECFIIFYVAANPRPFVTDLSEGLQRDKAQVSRSVNSLIERGFLTRADRRAPLRLTETGLELNQRLDVLLVQRNEALLNKLSADDLHLLDRLLDKLYASANTLLLEERRLSRDGDGAAVSAPPVSRPGNVMAKRALEPAAGTLLMPDLHVLLRLVRRSAALAYVRVTGLSNFDWRTLTHAHMSGPITLSELIEVLDRNKSQVGRAVARLTDLGLTQRRRDASLGRIVVWTTPEGAAAYKAVLSEAQRRNEFLAESLTPRERHGLMKLLDQMIQNANGLLEKERDSIPPGAAGQRANDERRRISISAP